MVNCKEQKVLEPIKDAFEGEDMQTQYTVIGYRIDLNFLAYKLAIQVDELGHDDRNIDYEIQRQRAIEKELGCAFIRINPDEDNFSIFKAIYKIHRHIKKSTKKSLIDKISKRLLKLEFKSNHSIITKALKRVVKMYCQITKNEKCTIKNKTNKNREKILEQHIVLGVKVIRRIFYHRK